MTYNTDKSTAYFEKARGIFPGGVNSPVRSFSSVKRAPFCVARGSGPYLFDIDGNQYIDMVNSWGPLVLGHAHPAVCEAICRQVSLGTSYGACCGLEADLAEELQRHYPSMEMLRFVSSGTEAGMAVIRLARGFTGRNKILKFTGCYHGHADALLVKAGSGAATLGIPGSAGVPEATVNDTLTVAYNDFAAVEEIFQKFPDQLAAVIIEPIVGNAGLLLPVDNFLQRLRAITAQHGTLLIFDEVMTGFRVALGGAQTLFDITPDLTMLGKVIGGGLPVGAFGGRAEIMHKLAPLGSVYQAGTLSGNPLALVAGLATLQEWTRAGVFENVAAQTTRLVAGLNALAAEQGVALKARSCGSMFGFFFSDQEINSYEEAQRADIAKFIRFFGLLLERGVYLAPSQYEAGFVSTAHTADIIDQVLKQVEIVLTQTSTFSE